MADGHTPDASLDTTGEGDLPEGELDIDQVDDVDAEDDAPLDDVRTAAQNVLERGAEELPALTVDVPSRDGVSLRVDPNLSVHQLQRWQKGCANNQMYGGVDNLKLACVILAHLTVDVLFHRRSSGWTFKDVEFRDMLAGAEHKRLDAEARRKGKQPPKRVERPKPSQAVRMLFGREPLVMQASDEVLAAAGLDEAMDEETGDDPTVGP